MMKCSLVFFVLLLSRSALGAELDGHRISRLEREIEAATAGLSPGVAIGVVKDGKVVYERYSGYSNIEHQVKVGAQTRFNIASNAKQFTALCVLELVHEGLIDLDGDVRDYLPEMFSGLDGFIPVFSLLNHSSGIRDVYDLWALQGRTWWELFLDNGDAIELLAKQRDLNAEPGLDYGYSNSNYLLLAEIVTRVTDQRFSDRAKGMFERLGMNQTSFLTNSMAVIPNRASPYGDWNGWKEYPTVTSLHADGGLFTTLPDQLAWECLLQSGRPVELDAELIATSQSPIRGGLIDEYGYGLSFGNYKGLDYAYHEGSTGAYKASFVRFPEKLVSVVVMSNNANISTSQVARDFAEAALPAVEWIPTKYPGRPDVIGKLAPIGGMVGVYETEDETIVRIVSRNGRLYREAYPAPPISLVHEEGNLYHCEGNPSLRIAFDSTTQRARSLKIYQSSRPPVLGLRMESQPIGVDYASTICGRYWNDETETEIVIRHRSGNAYSLVKNGRERDGTLVIRDRLRERSYTFRIQRDEAERVCGLLVDHGRIKNVQFEKR